MKIKRLLSFLLLLLTYYGGGNLAWADVSTDKYTTKDGIRYVLHLDKTATVAKFFPSQLNDPETITIPSSVTFEGITYTVTEFYLHSNVGDFLKNNEEIEECTKVTSISIPATLKTFTPGKFSVDVNKHFHKYKLCYEGDHTSLVKQLPNLRYFIIDSNNPYFTHYHNQLLLSKDKTTLYCCPPGQSDPTAVIFTGIKHIGPYAFVGCKLTKFIVPASLESVDDNAFSGFSALQKFTSANEVQDTKYQVYDGVLFEFSLDNFKKYTKPSKLVSYPDAKKVIGYTIKTNDLYGSPSSIAPFAFDDVVIKNVFLPKAPSETTIGRCAFFNATINSFSTSNPIYKIEEFAFTDANSFQSFTCDNVKFGEGVSVMRVLPYAFWNSKIIFFRFPTRKVNNNNEAQLYIDIDDYAFFNSKNLASLDIPASTSTEKCLVRKFGKWCFAGCTGMASFDFKGRTLSGNHVLGVPEGAFAQCSNLQSVYFDDNAVDSIGSYAFYGTQLTSWCFRNQNESLRKIGNYAFAKGFMNLNNLGPNKDVSNNFSGEQFNIDEFSVLETIGEGAFAFCNIDKALSFYKQSNSNSTLIKKIEPYSFAGNKFKTATLTLGIEEIGSGAFIDNHILEKIEIPSTTKKITWLDKTITGASRYYYGSYHGNLKLNQIIVRNNDRYGTNSTNYLLYDKETKTIIHCAENYGINTIGGGNTKKGVIIENEIPGITGIEQWAFAYNQNFEKIILPSTLTKIGEAAFAYAQNLTSLTIPAKVTTIGKEPLHGCSSCKDVYFMPSTPPTITNQENGTRFIDGNEGHNGVNIYFKKTSESKYLAAKSYINAYTTANYTYKIPFPKEYQVKQKKFTMCHDFDIDCRKSNFAVYAINKYSKANEVPGRTLKRYVPSRIGAKNDKYVGVVAMMYRDEKDPGYIEDGNWYSIGESDYSTGTEQVTKNEVIGENGENNWLVPCLYPTYVSVVLRKQSYGMKNSKFARYIQDGYVPANKAYLYLDNHPYSSSSAAKELNIVLLDDEENETTDIDAPIVDVNMNKNTEYAVYYNLNGMKVEHPTKGIYICNGKKVVIK